MTDRRRLTLTCIALATVGLAFRLLLIGSKSLWADEAYAAGLMGSSLPELVAGIFRGSPHPPLAFIAIHISTALFGTSEMGLRLVPALMSAAAVVPLYLFTRRKVDGRGAFFCGCLWAVSPYAVSLGQEAWLYGPLAFMGFLYVLVADLTWEGNRRALYALVPLGLAGMLVHHMFLLFMACGFGLYFTRPRDDRISFRKVVAMGVITVAVYAPFAIPAARQIALRAERLARANLPATAHLRLARRVPTVLARLIPGGVAGELSPSMLGQPVTGGIFILSLAGACAALTSLFTDKRIGKGLRLCAAVTLFAPFLMFVNEDPTVRHLSILWIPLALGIGSISRRFVWSGPVLLVLSALLLLPYYRTEAYPYHRSDYREAAEIVAEGREPGQEVVILGGQNGGLAWDYYYQGSGGRIAIGGENPYEVQSVRGGMDRLAVLDSILDSGVEAWVVHDIWGGPAGRDLSPGHRVLFHEFPSAHMEVLLFGD